MNMFPLQGYSFICNNRVHVRVLLYMSDAYFMLIFMVSRLKVYSVRLAIMSRN